MIPLANPSALPKRSARADTRDPRQVRIPSMPFHTTAAARALGSGASYACRKGIGILNRDQQQGHRFTVAATEDATRWK
jgi:hypothetical protein